MFKALYCNCCRATVLDYIQTLEDYLGYDRYTYCRGNPFKWVDPSGERYDEDANIEAGAKGKGKKKGTKEGEYNRHRIITGEYGIEYRMSFHFGEKMMFLTGVDGHTGNMFHLGNYASNTTGCFF